MQVSTQHQAFLLFYFIGEKNAPQRENVTLRVMYLESQTISNPFSVE